MTLFIQFFLYFNVFLLKNEIIAPPLYLQVKGRGFIVGADVIFPKQGHNTVSQPFPGKTPNLDKNESNCPKDHTNYGEDGHAHHHLLDGLSVVVGLNSIMLGGIMK